MGVKDERIIAQVEGKFNLIIIEVICKPNSMKIVIDLPEKCRDCQSKSRIKLVFPIFDNSMVYSIFLYQGFNLSVSTTTTTTTTLRLLNSIPDLRTNVYSADLNKYFFPRLIFFSSCGVGLRIITKVKI